MNLVEQTTKEVKEEVGATLKELTNSINGLGLNTVSTEDIKRTYNLITRESLGISYEELIEDRKLPPMLPSKLFDQKRLGFANISVLGTVFFPSLSSNNLSSLQTFYLNSGNDLKFVRDQLEEHPPVDLTSSTFINVSNKFVIRAIASRKANGTLKGRDEISSEVGVSSFNYFIFPDNPQSIFVVYKEFIGADESLDTVSRREGVPKEQLANSVFWFGGINTDSNNLLKMRSFVKLPSPQIRSATFGDDIGISNSQRFTEEINSMAEVLSFAISSKNPKAEDTARSLEDLKKRASEFLARFSFISGVLNDPFILDKTLEGGVVDEDLEFSFVNRDDVNFKGANLEANALLSTVWPPTDNSKNIRLLSEALRQSSDTPKFTTNELNVQPNFREDVLVAAQRLVAGIKARENSIIDPTTEENLRKDFLSNIALDLNQLNAAYSSFLEPPIIEAEDRKQGSRTTESTNISLTRSTNIVKSLRIKDQINEFPLDFNGEISKDLQQVLGTLTVMANAIESYLDLYKSDSVSSFLSSAISVSSVTNLLFSDGDPVRGVLPRESPGLVSGLSRSVSSNILENEAFPDNYIKVSSKLDSFISILRGSVEKNLVEKLLDLPIIFINSVFSGTGSFVLVLENNQGPAMEQLSKSFDIIRTTTPSILRDLSEISNNFKCAFTEAGLFVSKTTSSSFI